MSCAKSSLVNPATQQTSYGYRNHRQAAHLKRFSLCALVLDAFITKLSPLRALAMLPHSPSSCVSSCSLLHVESAQYDTQVSCRNDPPFIPKSTNGYNLDPVIFEGKFQQPIRNKTVWCGDYHLGLRGCCKLFSWVLYLACQRPHGHGSQ